MKLKYKKIIMLTAMSTMGIGVLTLSVSQDSPKAEESLSTRATVEGTILQDSTNSNINTMSSFSVTDASMAPTAAAPTPTLSPTPTPIPVYKIEVGAYPEINLIFEDYYKAKNGGDVDKLKSILSDPSKVESLQKLQNKTEYIEDYRNIETYTKKGLEAGTYIVYVYSEIKFTNVNTAAPGLAKFYLITDEDSKLKIFSGEMDEVLKAYFDARNEDEDVLELIEMTNDKSEKAKEKDEDLFNFWKNIDKIANKEQKSSEGDSVD